MCVCAFLSILSSYDIMVLGDQSEFVDMKYAFNEPATKTDLSCHVGQKEV